jgi:hypothetical protein
MKPAIAVALTICILPWCRIASAADWVPVSSAGAVDQYFYDRSKLTIKDEEITYWKKVIFQSPQSINGKEIASGMLRERIHCAEHIAKLVSYLYYAPGGETVEYVAKDESEPAPIIPDTVGDAFEHKLCPLVWQKQEEARIKAEQKAAQAELAAAKKEEPKVETKPETVSPLPGKALPAAPLPMPQVIEQLY